MNQFSFHKGRRTTTRGWGRFCRRQDVVGFNKARRLRQLAESLKGEITLPLEVAVKLGVPGVEIA